MVRDLTHGKPRKLILSFCIPMIFGNLFQQMYNMADTIIVGQFVGVDALAAVGSTGSLNFLVIGFILGLCSGFAIPAAQSFGAGDFQNVRRSIANAVWLALGFTVVVTAVTVLFTRQILTAMNTPANIFEDAYIYIVTIFAGIFATFLYNFLSCIMRALGDSRTPLYFLVIASILNIILDLVFILVFNSGVFGAALATVISQAVSGILCLLYVVKKFPILHMEKGDWKPSKCHISRLFGMGVPMGLQFSITAIGSTILQTAVNSLGSGVVAAITAASKVQMLFTQPIETLGTTMATYCGQNLGAAKVERIHKGVRISLIYGAVYSVVAFGVLILAGTFISLLFIDSAEVTAELTAHIRQFQFCNGLFFVLLSTLLVLRNSIQGMSHGLLAMLAGVFEMVARTSVAFLLVDRFGFDAVCFANPIAWVAAVVLLVPAYLYVSKKLKQQFKQVKSV